MTTGRKRARVKPEQLKPDLVEAQRFLELLDEPRTRFTFQCIPETDNPSARPVVLDGTLEQQARRLIAHHRRGCAVHVMINRGDGRGRKAENVTDIRANFVDLDGALLEPVLACALEPHVIVESSPGRYHCYWRSSSLPLDRFASIQSTLARRFGGDPAVIDLPRVMRLPGFLHRKGGPFRSRIVEDTARVPYTAEEILAEFPPAARQRGTNGEAPDSDAADYVPDDELISGIIRGERFHEATRDLAARYARRGMSQRDVLKTLRGHMKASRAPRDARWQERFNGLVRLVESAADWAIEFDVARREPSPDGWRPPAEPAPAPYPLESLPAVLGDAVAEHQAISQQPLELVATSALSAASLAVQGLVDVDRDRLLRGPSSLYALVLAESGERKTHADAAFVGPIREAESSLREREAEAIAAAKLELAKWTAKRDGLLARIKDKTKQAQPAEVEKANRELDQLSAAPEVPPEPFLLFEDTTPEALARDLANGWPSAGLWSSEGGTILNSWSMTDDKGSVRYLAMLNKLWGGEEYRAGRITRERITLQGRRFSASVMVQPNVFRQFVTANGGAARGTGLVARFLVCEPRSTMGTRFYREPPEDTPALERYAAAIERILALPLPLDDQGRLQPVRLTLSPAAKARWIVYADAVEVELPGDLEDVKDIAAKSAEQAARIAGVFHVFERCAEGVIGEDTMDRAIMVASWYLAETKRLLGLADASREEQNGRDLLRFLKKRGGPVWLRDISTFVSSRALRRNPKLRAEAIDWLCDQELARKYQTQGRTYVEATP